MKNQEKKTGATEDFQAVGELKLKRALLLDGKPVKALPYDFDALTAQDLIDADRDRVRENDNLVYVQTIDTTSLICLFAKAVAYKTPNCELSDILRLSALDAQAAITLTRRFFSQGTDAEDCEDETSETAS